MKKTLQLLVGTLRDEGGAEGLEKILIVAAIVLPLLGVLLIFRDKIQTWVTQSWEWMTGESTAAGASLPNPGVPPQP